MKSIKHTKTYGIILLSVVALALSGCIKPHIQPHVSMAQKAHQTCVEYGATQGSRMFYSCMKSQMRKERYNQAVSSCTSYSGQDRINEQCEQDIAIGSPYYWQELAKCKSNLTTRCERQASNEYLHRNNAQKYDLNIHDYNHNYNDN